MLPSRYNAQISLDDAREMAGIARRALRRDPDRGPVRRVPRTRSSRSSAGSTPDATEENIQARIRGTLLMALSNKTGAIVLTTGNKSEMAVGYATLYGDMAGGFARAEGRREDAGLPARALPQRARPRDPRAHHHAAAVGRAAREPDRPGLAAALRRPRRDPRGLRRGGLEPGGDRRARATRPTPSRAS